MTQIKITLILHGQELPKKKPLYTYVGEICEEEIRNTNLKPDYNDALITKKADCSYWTNCWGLGYFGKAWFIASHSER